VFDKSSSDPAAKFSIRHLVKSSMVEIYYARMRRSDRRQRVIVMTAVVAPARCQCGDQMNVSDRGRMSWAYRDQWTCCSLRTIPLTC
jgi:hypothetical protein